MSEPQLKDIHVAHLQPVEVRLSSEREEAKGVLEMIGDMPMEHQGDYDFAGEILVEVKSKKKALEDERGKATRPMLDALNVIRGWFKPAVDYYGRCESALKRKMADYTLEQRKKQQEALAAAGQASMAGQQQVARQALQVASDAQVHKAAGVTTRSVIKYEVIDASQVPREFLCINDMAIKLYISTHGAEAKIPGVRIFEDVQIGARTK